MNANSEQKKQKEENALNAMLNWVDGTPYTQEFIQYIKSLKRIVEHPLGEERDIEQPDFWFLDPSDPEKIVGIEHFAANQISEIGFKKKKEHKGETIKEVVKSTGGNLLLKEQRRIFDAHHTDCVNNRLNYDKAMKDSAEHIEHIINEIDNHGFDILQKSIVYSCNEHIRKMENEKGYAYNLTSFYPKRKSVEINFLFDITECFSLIHVNEYGAELKVQPLLFWPELVNFLASLENHSQIKNIILYYHDINNQLLFVVVFKNKNIKRQIYTQFRVPKVIVQDILKQNTKLHYIKYKGNWDLFPERSFQLKYHVVNLPKYFENKITKIDNSLLNHEYFVVDKCTWELYLMFVWQNTKLIQS